MMHGGNYGWGMGFGWIWMILFWGLVTTGIVYLVQTISRSAEKSNIKETPPAEHKIREGRDRQ